MAKKPKLSSGMFTSIIPEDPMAGKVLVAQLKMATIETRLKETQELLLDMERRANHAVELADEAEQKFMYYRKQFEELYDEWIAFQKEVKKAQRRRRTKKK